MKYKTYLFLAGLSLFSLAGHSYFHEDHTDHDHHAEAESCTFCHLSEATWVEDEFIVFTNNFLEDYYFSSKQNLSNLSNKNLLIRAPPVG